jgi:small subunit ribosomal protein S7
LIEWKEAKYMPRKGPVPRRDVLPDPVYGSKVVTRLVNKVMYDGKKGTAQGLVYEAFDMIRERTGKDPVEMFDAALKNIMPVLEVKARRVGGANYQVPIEVRPERRSTLGIRWLVNFSRNRNEKSMTEKLAAEIMDAANNTGAAVKRREDMHKMAEANKAFSHYRW